MIPKELRAIFVHRLHNYDSRCILGGNRPCATTSTMHFIYVLESRKDGKRYIGYTQNLRRRLEEHQQGTTLSTRFRLPMKFICFEGCVNEEDAKRRELYLKTTKGNRFLAKRLKTYYGKKVEAVARGV